MMFAVLLLFFGHAICTVFRWISQEDGLWTNINNWDPIDIPSQSSYVVLPPQTALVTITVTTDIVLSSLTISTNISLLFTYNSTLNISDNLIIHGGCLHSDSSFSTSFTSTTSLTVDALLFKLLNHLLIVTHDFHWVNGSMDLLHNSKLLLTNCSTTVTKDDPLPGTTEVHAWGPTSGQLGGDVSDTQPIPFSYTLPFTTRQISLGLAHSILLSDTGEVYTSGSNNHGQLGEVTSNRNFHQKIGLSSIFQVSANRWSSFALTFTGRVYSWGRNNQGQLGLGHFHDRTTPTLIPNLNNVKQIFGRYLTSFVVTRDGKVFGWGRNSGHVLCREGHEDVLSPTLIESLQNIKYISTGMATFFIKEDGSTLTCGRVLGGSGSYSTPTPFAEDIEFTFIDTDSNHALGIDVNQTLWSWGLNTNGQLGTGDLTRSDTPLKVILIGKVIMAAAGQYHCVAFDVSNDVWSWGDRSDGALGRIVQGSESRFPGIIPELSNVSVSNIFVYARSNFAFFSVPRFVDSIKSSSNNEILTLEETNHITGEVNVNVNLYLNLISLPVFLSGSLNLTSDSFFFLSEFNLNGLMSINSPRETYFNSLILGASECSTLSLESNVFVETLYWYCGTIEGVGELKVNTLVLCSSNPELKLSRISVGKMMTSELNVGLNLTFDLVLFINGIIEIPLLSFYSDLNVTVTFGGDFKLLGTLISLYLSSHLESIVNFDPNSKIQIHSSASTLSSNLPLFLYYDWSKSPSLNDLSGNDNNVLELSGAEWNPNGYYQFGSSSDTLNIPNIPGKFGWESATISLLIWFDLGNLNRFGLATCNCGLQFGDYLYHGCTGSTSFNPPRNRWINLIMTTSGVTTKFYINGELLVTMDSQYHCETVSEFFPLGSRYSFHTTTQRWTQSPSVFFKGLTESEITSEFAFPPSITGLGSIELKNSELTLLEYSSISFSKLILESSTLYLLNHVSLYGQTIVFNYSECVIHGKSETLFFVHSLIHLDKSVISYSGNSLHLFNLSIINSVFDLSSVDNLSFNELAMYQNSTIADYNHLSIAYFHWFDGVIYQSQSIRLMNLFLYGESKSLLHNSLTIENELYFRNSLTFFTSGLSLINLSVTCFPGSELILDSSFDDSLLEVENQLYLTSICSVTSLLPVQSTGIIVVGNDSLLTLYKNVETTNVVVILPKGELVLRNCTVRFDDSDQLLHPELFLYYSWVTSLNQIDLSKILYPVSTIIEGPEWKFDSLGGYLDITPGNTLHIPNIPGEFGWRDASILCGCTGKKEELGLHREIPSVSSTYVPTEWIGAYQWFHLVITFDQSNLLIYINGIQESSLQSDNGYKCSNSYPSYFSLSGIIGSSFRFKGRIREVQVFNKTLTSSEIGELNFSISSFGGWGKLSLLNSKMVYYNSVFGIKSLSLTSSILHFDTVTFIELGTLKLDFSELHYDVIDFTAEVTIDSIFLTNTSSIITDASFYVNNLYWFDGDFIFCSSFVLQNLFLYGESKIGYQSSLILENELYFNNSLTFSLSHLALIAVSVSCFPGSELVLDSSSFDDGLLEVKNFLHLSSNCSFTSLLPVQSSGIISVANHSFITLYNVLRATGMFMIFHKGELVLKNSIITFEGSGPYLHSDLFLYYNWINSSNPVDLSQNHDLNAIVIDGPEWKSDDIGGYLDVKPGDTLHIPNIPGTQGWRDASMSLWIYFEEGGMGFNLGSPCRFYITTTRIFWGSNWESITCPLNKWFRLAIAFGSSEARIYFDGVYQTSFVPNTPYNCVNSHSSYFPLSEVKGSIIQFTGKIRIIQILTTKLSISDFNQLTFDIPQGIRGRGQLSFVDSKVNFISSHFSPRLLSLTGTILQSNNLIFENLQQAELYSQSILDIGKDSVILSDSLRIILDSSELLFDQSVNISSSTLSLIASNSRFQNDFDFANINVLDLSFSTFESFSDTRIRIAYFSCIHCQILGNYSLLIHSSSEINSGNFSSLIIFQESVGTSLISGQVQLADCFEFLNHVILDDVSVSEFLTSSDGSITCHSDVLMRNDVRISSVFFVFNDTLTFFDATFQFEELFQLFDFQTVMGFGTIVTNCLNFGRLYPSSIFTFEHDLSLSPSSSIFLKVNNDSTSTQLIVGSTAHLDGILEIEFDTNHDSISQNYTLIESGLINGRFSTIINPCASLISMIYSRTSLIVSVNDYVANLNQVSYISTYGVDDSCCGSFNSPCASFKGVLERMGRKGKVYFHSGYYFLNHGLGSVTNVDWEVIGLGDVFIEGIDETIFEIFDSVFILSNFVIKTSTSNAFHISNSTVNINDSISRSSCSSIDGLVVNSILNILSSVFSSFSFEITSSEVDFSDSVFHGFVPDFVVSNSSSITVSTSSFYNITTNSLFNTKFSNLFISQSYFSEITTNSLINLNNSQLIFSQCEILHCHGDVFVDGYHNLLMIKYLDLKFSNFRQWFNIVHSSFYGQDLLLTGNQF
ncbi:hypothetical protein GEMRC1_009219 [Eukaryota sp. GEM-RC1]